MANIAQRAAQFRDPSLSGLTRANVLEMYRLMLVSRMVSERMWLLNRSGKAHFIVTGEGHEAAQVGSAFALRAGYDFALPYYRDIGVVTTLGMSTREILLNVLNRAGDPNSGGRQMPSHWSHPELRIVSQSSIVASQILHAVGIAHASRIKGEDTVAVVYFGDGATSKGDFHEGLNWAGLYDLPVVFICENNGYAISLPSSKQMAIPQVAERAAAYGMPGITVDGTDVFATFEVAQQAMDRARRGEGPTLIEAITYRYAPHTSNDDDTVYRSPAEVAEWRERDPITRLRDYLIESGEIDDAEDEAINQDVKREVDEAEAFAEASPLPQAEDALRFVYGGGAAGTQDSAESS